MKLTPQLVDEVLNYLETPADGDFPAHRIPAMEEAIAFLGLRPRGEHPPKAEPKPMNEAFAKLWSLFESGGDSKLP